MVFPTQDQIDLAFAQQEAENTRKFLAQRGGQVAPDHRDAAVELASLQASITAPPGGWSSAEVLVNRAPLRPVLVSPPNPVKPEAYCKYCGRLFKAKTVAGAKMSKGRHEKREHLHESATV